MTHYNISYDGLEGEAKQAKAIADIKDYLGGARKFNEITAMLRSEADGKIHQRWFEVACSFAGVQGYPVVAWWHHCFPHREWIEEQSADVIDLEVARKIKEEETNHETRD